MFYKIYEFWLKSFLFVLFIFYSPMRALNNTTLRSSIFYGLIFLFHFLYFNSGWLIHWREAPEGRISFCFSLWFGRRLVNVFELHEQGLNLLFYTVSIDIQVNWNDRKILKENVYTFQPFWLVCFTSDYKCKAECSIKTIFDELCLNTRSRCYQGW